MHTSFTNNLCDSFNWNWKFTNVINLKWSFGQIVIVNIGKLSRENGVHKMHLSYVIKAVDVKDNSINRTLWKVSFSLMNMASWMNKLMISNCSKLLTKLTKPLSVLTDSSTRQWRVP